MSDTTEAKEPGTLDGGDELARAAADGVTGAPRGDAGDELAQVAAHELAAPEPDAGGDAASAPMAASVTDEPLLASASADAEPAYHASMTFLFVVAAVNLVLDVASKQWIKAYFEDPSNERQKIVVVDGVAQLIYATNKGGAWGILQGEHEALRRPFFLVVSVAAIVFIVSLYRKLAKEQLALKWGLPLVLGGAIGNLVDRVLYGSVIDFIDVYITSGGAEKHWPTFNVADIAICIGVGLMAVDMFTSPTAHSGARSAPSSG